MSEQAVNPADPSTANNDIVLLAAGIRKYYPIKTGIFKRRTGDVKAVDGVDLQITRGQTLGLVGESGCGKSTLARVLADLREPTRGNLYYNVPREVADEISVLSNQPRESLTESEKERLHELNESYSVAEMDAAEYGAFRKNIQFVFQNIGASLNPRRMIGDVVARPLKIHSDLTKNERDQRVIDLLERVDLSGEYLTRYPHELSGGQRQRVAIAQSIATNPHVVILDEPTSALDVSVQAQILNLLQELQDDLGMAYLLITHDLGVVHHIAERVAVMYLGKIVEIGDRHDVFQHAKHPYTEALISAIPEASDSHRIFLEGDVPDPENPPTGCKFHSRCHKVESRCGWSGRDLMDLLARLDETYPPVTELTSSIKDTGMDGFKATLEFDEAADMELAAAVLSGDHCTVQSEQPELFRAIEEVAVDSTTVHVTFKHVQEPELVSEGNQHEVRCVLYE